MTFSDPDVAAFVNKNFVSAWSNRGPGFHNDDYSTEKWIFSSDMEAYPTKNICTFMLAPDGKVFDYAAGFYCPELMMKILKAAVELRGALFDAKMQPKDGGLEAAQKIHAVRAGEFVLQRERARKAQGQKDGWQTLVGNFKTPTYRGQRHQHGAACAAALTAGYDYLSRLHQAWSEAAGLPGLDEMRYAYLWGNSFTEEAANSRQIAENDAGKTPDPYANLKDKFIFASEASAAADVKLGKRGVKVDTGLPSIVDPFAPGR